MPFVSQIFYPSGENASSPLPVEGDARNVPDRFRYPPNVVPFPNNDNHFPTKPPPNSAPSDWRFFKRVFIGTTVASHTFLGSWEVIDYVDQYIDYYTVPLNEQKPPLSHFVRDYRNPIYGMPIPFGAANQQHVWSYYGGHPDNAHGSTGQYMAPPIFGMDLVTSPGIPEEWKVIPSWVGAVIKFWGQLDGPSWGWTGRNDECYVRIREGESSFTATRPYASPWRQINPNVERFNPPRRTPRIPRMPRPRLPRVPDEWIWISPPTQPMVPRAGSGPRPRRRGMPAQRQMPGYTPRAGSAPPNTGVKEAKVKNRAWVIAVAVFHALDEVSEFGDFVDVLFNALPEATVKRWKKAHANRQFVDQAGQYGIGGADWKMRAIFYNWEHIDVGAALENWLLNWIEDKVIGEISRGLPVTTINALGHTKYDPEREERNGQRLSHEAMIAVQLKNALDAAGVRWPEYGNTLGDFIKRHHPTVYGGAT